MITIETLLVVFAQFEEEQAEYFADYDSEVIVSVGRFEVTTRHARMVALCALADYAKKGELLEGEIGERLSEIAALANYIIETTGIWAWLVLHPNKISDEIEGCMVDPMIYEIWSVMRRLCREAVALLNANCKLEPFQSYFSPIVLP